MRRVIALVLVALFVALIWYLFAARDGAVDGAGTRSAAAPADAPAPVAPKVSRVRTPEEVREEQVSAFLAQWPEVGQDVPQDPKKGAIKGRVMKSKEVPATQGIAEVALRGDVAARAKVAGAGEFLLKNVPPGQTLSLAARAPDFAPGGVERLLVVPGQTLDVGFVYLGAAMDDGTTNHVEVRVLDAEAKPVAGARVTGTSTQYGALVVLGAWEKQPGGTVVHAVTDATGTVAFDKLPPQSYDFFAEADGLTFEVEQRYLVQNDTKATVTLQMGPAVTIEGLVTDPEGKPVAQAHIGAFSMATFTMSPAVFSGDDGRFTVPGLSPGKYSLFTFKEEVGEKETAAVDAGAKDVAIQLVHGAEMILRVTDAATGAPVKAFGVRPFQTRPFAYLFSPLVDVKSEDGIWRQAVSSQSYGVEVSAKGYAQKSIASVPLPSKEPFEVKLDAARVLHGKVVAKGDGRPVRGAKAYVKRGGFPPSPVKDLQTVTDENGVFVLDGMPATDLAIWISHVDHTDQSFTVSGKPRGEGGALPPVEEFAIGSGGRIEGHAYGEDHAPLAGTSIYVSPGAMDFLAMRNAVVAADGAYALRNVPPGTYRVAVGSPFGSNAKNGVVVTEGGVVTVDFGAATGGQPVAGKLVKDDRSPVPGVSVQLDDASGQSHRTETDKDGRFRFENVAPGKVSLRSWGRTRIVDVVVKAEEPPAEVTLVIESGSIEVRFVDTATGEALTGVWADCEQTADGEGRPPEQSIRSRRGGGPVNGEGTIRFNALDAGTYRIRGQRDPYGSEVFDGVVLAAGEKKTGVEVRMTSGAGTVAGTAKNARGQPIEGASVQIKDDKGRSVFSIAFVKTSSDGTYSQGQLKPGDYDVTLEMDGHVPATKHVTIEGNKETRADFTLISGGRVDVWVRRGSTGVASASVALLDAAGRVVERGLTLSNIFSGGRTTTDVNGQITLTGLAAGAYTVRARTDDGGEATKPVEVVEGASTSVEVVLP